MKKGQKNASGKSQIMVAQSIIDLKNDENVENQGQPYSLENVELIEPVVTSIIESETPSITEEKTELASIIVELNETPSIMEQVITDPTITEEQVEMPSVIEGQVEPVVTSIIEEVLAVTSIIEEPVDTSIIKETLGAEIENQVTSIPEVKKGRDNTKFEFQGEFFGKGPYVRIIVATYMEKHPETTIVELKSIFPDALLKRFGIFQNVEKAKEISGKTPRYFLKPDQIIIVGEEKIAVCSQFTAENIKPFLEVSKKLGF